MSDQEFEALRKKCKNIFDKWQDILGLQGHRFKVKYLREYHQERFTVATCRPLWQYKTHAIDFYLPSVNELEDDDELEEDILHELVHVLLAPSTGNDPAKDEAQLEQNEFTTQSITYGLIWAYQTGQDHPKRKLISKGNKNVKTSA